MGRLETRKIKVTGAGSAGSATGSAVETVPPCYFIGVYVDFTSAPSTTDTTIKALANSDVGEQTIVVLTNNNTDGWQYPRRQVEDNAGAAVTGAYDKFFVPGAVEVSIAQGDAVTDEVIAYVVIEVP